MAGRRYKLSERGIAFLKRIEGFRSRIYPDAGKWAIGIPKPSSFRVMLGARRTG